MKRTLSLVLALAMILGSFSFVFAADKNVTDKAGEFLKEVGVLEGNDDGNLMLDKNLKRRDMVILLSRLMGVESTAKNFPSEGILTFKDITDANYKGYLAWAVSNKLIEGHTPERFGFNEQITAQQYAAILLRALGYEIDDAAYAKVLETSKGLGILKDVEVENKTEISRGQMAVMTLNALGVKIKGTDKTLAEKLGIKLPGEPVPEKLEVVKVEADNLKEVKIVFNKAVDKDNAEDKANYSLNSGSIKDAKVVEDNTVILTLEGEMTNKKEYTLNIKGIKDGGATVNTSFKFKAIDNAIPEVVEVVGLGTKALKVVMSEPVKNVKSSSFLIDGKTYYGSVSVTGREIVLKPYGTSFSTGEHTLVVKSLEDFAGFKSVEKEIRFEVAEDKEVPTVVEVKGTMERVVVTFSEDIDDSSVTRDSLYWGGTKTNKADRVVKLAGDRYAFEFSREKSLPTYEVNLTISGAKDYSGNQMKSTEMPFRAELDEARLEVVELDVKDEQKITVRFSKPALKEDAVKVANYILKDEDGKKVSLKTPEISNDLRVVTLTLYSKLAPNKEYTLSISGIRDNTKLANSMLPYEERLTAGDYSKPKVDSIIGNNEERTIYVGYNKSMDIESISNPSNYMIVINDGSGWQGRTATYPLKELGGDINVVQDGKAVILTLPEKINNMEVGKTLKLGAYENGRKKITSVIIMDVEDAAGNKLADYGVAKAIAENVLKVESDIATAVDKKTLEVKFDQPIVRASKDDFVSNKVIDDVIVDGTSKVIIEFADEFRADASDVNLTIKANKGLESITGRTFTADKKLAIVDKVQPSLQDVKAVWYNQNRVVLTLTFDEALDSQYSTLAKRDLTINVTNDKTIDTSRSTVNSVIYGDKLILTITDPAYIVQSGAYDVQILTTGSIRDLKDNVVNKTTNSVIGEVTIAR
jgi:hypothetical protein